MQISQVTKAMGMLAGGALMAGTATAGVTVYKDDSGKYVKLGGRIQLQYNQANPNTGSTTDEVIFRRLRPYIEGSLHKDWKGKFQFDLGKANGGNEVSIKDAYFQYKGFDGMKVTVGNANFPFSREFLTSSKYQQLVERTFVGDGNYGTPDRNTGIHLTGSNGDNLTWGASLASAAIDPDEDKLDFDNPVNRDADFNEGWMVGGRVDFHPFGILKFSQGDFKGEQKATIGVAAFSWSNDDDNNTYSSAAGVDSDLSNDDMDVESVTGFEISGAYRNRGLSVDAQYNRFEIDAVDNSYNQGLYVNGSTTLKNWSLEGGYMVVPNTIEVVAGYSEQDADGYSTEWTRSSLGANWFLRQHDVKVQLTYRQNGNVNGSNNRDEDEIFLQGQYVF